MAARAHLIIHASQFPGAVLADLRQSLRTRQINHKFHYDSYKQARQWLALHEAWSPARTDPRCAATYETAFAAVGGRITARRIHVIGLGCGGGQKDAQLLEQLEGHGKELSYTPVDVSTALVLTAYQAAAKVLGHEEVPFRPADPNWQLAIGNWQSALVCDLAAADLPAILDELTPPEATRLITFFGMLPNFEPQLILPRLGALVRRGDCLLCSANLAPGHDYAAGVRRVLPQYDNALTSDWLLTFLLDSGVDKSDGELEWTIEEAPKGSGWLRIAAYFCFTRPCAVEVAGEKFPFAPGDRARLFFSYRYTPEQVSASLRQHGLQVREQWITPSQEEGVFLARRAT